MAEALWIIPFGKYKDTPIEDVETSYLKWVMEQDWFLEKFTEGSKQIKKELEFRLRFDNNDEPTEDQNWNRKK